MVNDKKFKKIEEQETSTDEGRLGVLDRHAKNAGLASYKAKKREAKFDPKQGDWPQVGYKSTELHPRQCRPS